MGCFLAVMVLSGVRTTQLGVVSAGHTDWLTAVASNQNYAAYMPGNSHSEQNTVQDPIQWTNGAQTNQRQNVFPMVKTNNSVTDEQRR
jgi:hypothetical protein